MNEIVNIYFLVICVSLLLAVILSIIPQRKEGWMRKVVAVERYILWMISAVGLFFYILFYFNHYNVVLPKYQSDLMTVYFSDVNSALKIDLHGIKDLSPCCEKTKAGCGCIETYTGFFSLKTEAWAVPCPDKFLPMKVNCAQAE